MHWAGIGSLCSSCSHVARCRYHLWFRSHLEERNRVSNGNQHLKSTSNHMVCTYPCGVHCCLWSSWCWDKGAVWHDGDLGMAIVSNWWGAAMSGLMQQGEATGTLHGGYTGRQWGAVAGCEQCEAASGALCGGATGGREKFLLAVSSRERLVVRGGEVGRLWGAATGCEQRRVVKGMLSWQQSAGKGHPYRNEKSWVAARVIGLPTLQHQPFPALSSSLPWAPVPGRTPFVRAGLQSLGNTSLWLVTQFRNGLAKLHFLVISVTFMHLWW